VQATLSAAVCAVLAAATFSGSHRTGLLAIGMVHQAEPIVVKSTSTIVPLDVENVGSSHDRLPSPPSDEALLRRAFDVAKRARGGRLRSRTRLGYVLNPDSH
jgi:uncharacterized protein (DUF1778 family)